ncbi:amino acid adenylation domain-containing protein [Saccharothrix longispora]|uniref:Phenyloxazoline synthase MbtB n=1 Tax=Saccharothrix longispora TaxID=33920 RepID=A0ABU1PS11_9PSEU|nr:amino acid adenylation domain-containing protein [Saccharothrix longispora]MDR6593419.1 amino acid adenylation domain-containing protein [Saccharothrix longispora]
MSSAPVSADVTSVTACVADVLGLVETEVDVDALLSELGLESFTAVRLRRRLLTDLGVDLPLTAFLGRATVRSVAAGERDPGADEPFPLTPIQSAYLVGREPLFPLGGVATFFYHEYDRVPGDDQEADLAALEAAWNRVVARHPMLRMVITPDARQRVLTDVPAYRFERVDLRDAADVDAALDAIRAESSHQVRPTDRWPLFDIRAALLPDGRTRLYVGIDVLTVDLGCWFQLIREWGALVADPDAALPEQTTTFAEFVRRRADDPAEQRRRETDGRYWSGRGLPPGPGLPWLRPAAELGVPRFTRRQTGLDETEWAALRKRAAGHGLSPTGVLLAAFGLVLDRWGATAPFSLNTTLFDRADLAAADRTPGLEHVVGDFTSTVLVDVAVPDLTAWRGFADYAVAVNRRFWSDMDHRSVSGMEVAQRPGDLDAAPAHPVVFTSGVGLSGDGPAPTDWLGREVFGVSQTPQVLLDHIVYDEAGRLKIAWDTVDGALAPDFVDGMRDAHVRLLRRLAHADDSWTDPALGWDPAFLPDAPLTATPFPDAGPLLDDPARTAAGPHADAPAVITPGGVVSHRELSDRADRVGAVLAGAGLGPGDLVAVVAHKGIDQVVAVLGVNRSGAGYVPVEPGWPDARVAALCGRASVRHAVVAPGTTTNWPDGVVVHRLDADGVLAGPEAAPRRAEPSDLAYAIFTSGSTGTPKGVAVEHRAVRTTLDDLAERFPLDADDRVLGLSAFSFDLSVYDVFTLLGVGGAVVLPDPERQRDPGHWLDLMAEHRVTVWNTAPALLEMLVEYAEIDPDLARAALSRLHLVFLSADWIPVTLPDRLRALAPHARVVSLGGATEGSIWSICHPIGDVDPAWPSIPYGRALTGQSFHVLDPEGRPCPVGVDGELHIGGDGLAREYVGDPVQTAQRFFHHDVLRRRLYRTGDLGRWRTDGTIEFLGRVDRQVKIRGHRIELGEVESVLDRAPGVRKSVAKSVPGPDDRPRLVAFVAPADPSSPPGDDDLIALLRSSVPEFMVPSRFVHLPEFPVTANGKIDYAALGNPYRRTSAPTASRPAATEAVAVAQVPAAPVERPTPSAPVVDGFGALLGSAERRGLGVTITVTPGALAPVEALTAAAEWAHEVRQHAAASGVALVERLPDSGLLAVDLGHPPAAVSPPTVTRDRPEMSDPRGTVNAGDPLGGDLRHGAGTHAVPVVEGADPAVERAVSDVVGDLLKAPVDATTPFFRLGATSLTLVLAHRRLAAELAPELTVVDLFANPTVRDLALFITRRRRGGAPTTPEPTPAPPTPAPPTSVAPADRQDAAARRRAARVLAGEVAR